jgi:hypothetical protein
VGGDHGKDSQGEKEVEEGEGAQEIESVANRREECIPQVRLGVQGKESWRTE